MVDPRQVLDQLIQEHREDYSGLSKLIGRNPAYIQQFVKRGTPRKLDERDRRILAHHFGVHESVLGGNNQIDVLDSDLMEVPVFERFPSKTDSPTDLKHSNLSIGFHRDWLRKLTGGSQASLSIVRMHSDFMEPTLRNNDELLVDHNDADARLRDGIYAMLVDQSVTVKRITVDPDGLNISVGNDNPLYRSWQNYKRAQINLIGRIIWVGRTII